MGGWECRAGWRMLGVMPQLALSAIGRDRPGIVAAATAVLLRHGVNVEDSRMSILRELETHEL